MDDDVKQALDEMREAIAGLTRPSPSRDDGRRSSGDGPTVADFQSLIRQLRAEGRTGEAKDLEEFLEERGYRRTASRMDRWFKEKGIVIVDDDEGDDDGDSAGKGGDSKGKKKPPPKKKTDDDEGDDGGGGNSEEPPPSTHWLDRPLFGGRKSEGE